MLASSKQCLRQQLQQSQLHQHGAGKWSAQAEPTPIASLQGCRCAGSRASMGLWQLPLAAPQAVAPAAHSAVQADAKPVVADAPDRTVPIAPCRGAPVQAALAAQAAGDPAVATAAIPFDCR